MKTMNYFIVIRMCINYLLTSRSRSMAAPISSSLSSATPLSFNAFSRTTLALFSPLFRSTAAAPFTTSIHICGSCGIPLILFPGCWRGGGGWGGDHRHGCWRAESMRRRRRRRMKKGIICIVLRVAAAPNTHQPIA